MKIIVAFDSFKESMSAIDASTAFIKGVKKVKSDIEVEIVPMADGGEGTLAVLQRCRNYEEKVMNCSDLMNQAISVTIAKTKDVCIIESASMCGLGLVESDKRNPLLATSYGLGEIVNQCIQLSVNKIIIGLGGTGVNDGGMGFLQALGVTFYKENEPLFVDHTTILEATSMDVREAMKNLKNIELIIASDVTSPLLGSSGATYTFGPQKGASKDDLIQLETNLTHLSQLMNQHMTTDISIIPGSGAAGGLGAALLLLNGKMISGIDLIMSESGLEHKIMQADYVFTGEGSIDSQSLQGKVISGIAKVCKKHNKPCIALAGKIDYNNDELYNLGITSVFSIVNQAKTLKEALCDGEKSMENIGENIIRLLK